MGWLTYYIKYIYFHSSLQGVIFHSIIFSLTCEARISSLEVKYDIRRWGEFAEASNIMVKTKYVVSYTQVFLQNLCRWKKINHRRLHTHTHAHTEYVSLLEIHFNGLLFVELLIYCKIYFLIYLTLDTKFEILAYLSCGTLFQRWKPTLYQR